MPYLHALMRREINDWIQARNTPVTAALRDSGIITPRSFAEALAGEQKNVHQDSVDKVMAMMAKEMEILGGGGQFAGQTKPGGAGGGDTRRKGFPYWEDPEWQAKRAECLRLHPKCFITGCRSGSTLEVHHKRYNAWDSDEEWWNVGVDDLITICHDHHREETAAKRQYKAELGQIDHYPLTWDLLAALLPAVQAIVEMVRPSQNGEPVHPFEQPVDVEQEVVDERF